MRQSKHFLSNGGLGIRSATRDRDRAVWGSWADALATIRARAHSRGPVCVALQRGERWRVPHERSRFLPRAIDFDCPEWRDVGRGYGWVPITTHSTPVPITVERLSVVQSHVHAHATQVTDTRDVNRGEDNQSKYGAQICSHVSNEKFLVVEAVAGKDLEKPEKLPAQQLDEVKSKKDVILEVQKKGSPFCDIEMDKVKGRIVLRGDIVQDDSGAHAVFTEQGLCASHNCSSISDECHCKTIRLCRTSSRCRICLHTSKMEIGNNSKSSNVKNDQNHDQTLKI